MNVLHYALETNCMPISMQLIKEGNSNLMRSKYMEQKSGVTGYRNALHILIQKGNKHVLEMILNQTADAEVEHDLVMMETLVQTEDPRPKLIPCLHLAAYHGQTAIAELLLDRNLMGIDTLNSKNESALMWAARQGQTETVQMLIKRGTNANLESDKGTTAFYLAVRYNHIDVARSLIIDGHADPNKTRKYGLVSPIIVASAYGNTEMVDLILSQSGVNVNMKIRGSETAIHYASREGYTDIVGRLLDNGAAPDESNDVGDTPLLLAAKCGYLDIVNILINNGAKMDQRNHEGHDIWQYAIEYKGNELLEALVVAVQDMSDPGRRPLSIAASMGKIDKIEFLVRLGLDVQTTDKDGNSFLHFAAMQDQAEVIKRFHTRELLDMQNKKGNTVFHIAAYRGHENTLKALMELKANPGIKNNKGETVLHSAAYSKRIGAESVGMLTEYTITCYSWDVLNFTDFQGNNSLHIAAKHASPEVLWEFRAVSIKDQDKDGMTPLHHAVRPGKPEVLDTMLDIFELARRDARINEQTFVSRETVLHLAANERHIDSIKRLIHLGADISERDCNGNTVLHRIILSCVEDSQRKLQYLEVFDSILDNLVTWWCIKNHISIPYASDRETIMHYREAAALNISHSILNNDGMSVCDLAFAVGCSDVLSRLLMMRGATYFVEESDDRRTHVFDISGLMPRTKRVQTKPSEAKEKMKEKHTYKVVDEKEALLSKPKETKAKKLSGMDWLMTCTDSMKTGEILDLPPVQIIERHFASIVAWTFTILLSLHIIYMSIFTYVGIEVQSAIRADNFSMDLSSLKKANAGVLYFLVPLEPTVIFIFFIYLFTRYCITGDLKRRIQLSKTQSIGTVLSVLQEYTLAFIYFSFAILVFMWIILLRSGYKYQDYVLAVSICMGWLLAISFTRGIKMVHYFYKMLLSIILRDVFRFLLVYMFVLLSISLAIHVIFQASEDLTKVYPTPGATVFLIFNLMMGMGELFDDTLDESLRSVNRTSDFIKTFYLLYIVLGSLVMLNVLIAMMNDSYSRVLREGSINWRIDSIRIGMEIERSLSLSRVFSSVSTTYGPLGRFSFILKYVILNESLLWICLC